MKLHLSVEIEFSGFDKQPDIDKYVANQLTNWDGNKLPFQVEIMNKAINEIVQIAVQQAVESEITNNVKRFLDGKRVRAYITP